MQVLQIRSEHLEHLEELLSGWAQDLLLVSLDGAKFTHFLSPERGN